MIRRQLLKAIAALSASTMFWGLPAMAQAPHGAPHGAPFEEPPPPPPPLVRDRDRPVYPGDRDLRHCEGHAYGGACTQGVVEQEQDERSPDSRNQQDGQRERN
ncbi:hypothetical protein H6G00_01790 [Leptolyngbya sp. FACHB-541]|uniref:hypothetical protein n=1 Tax=Leptolyngbya sp. FACHB-541 TaxID=2692810 RepID=UPI001687E80E|nr:hypothetical protein [Leptolyngbya sp. FACHB-541]MBD1995363.1 hypothetical protein [Leptolyngbya sp. FACHB-541]